MMLQSHFRHHMTHGAFIPEKYGGTRWNAVGIGVTDISLPCDEPGMHKNAKELERLIATVPFAHIQNKDKITAGTVKLARGAILQSLELILSTSKGSELFELSICRLGKKIDAKNLQDAIELMQPTRRCGGNVDNM